MLDVKTIEDDHYLHVTIGDEKLKAKFTCINHEECEAGRLVREDNANTDYAYNDYDMVLEWYDGDEAVLLENGNVWLKTNDEGFVNWRYLNPPQQRDEFYKNIRNSHESGITHITWVLAHRGPVTEFRCMEKHDHYSEIGSQLCLGESITNEASDYQWSAYAGEEGTDHRNDFVTVTYDKYDDPWGVEGDGMWRWSYSSDV